MSIWALAETRFRDRSDAVLLLFKTKEQAERRVEVRKVELMLEAILDADSDIVWKVVGRDEGDANALQEAKKTAATLPKDAFLPHWNEFNEGGELPRKYSFAVSLEDVEGEDEANPKPEKKRKIEKAPETWQDHCRTRMFAQVVCDECGGGVAGKCACAHARWLMARGPEPARESFDPDDVIHHALRRQGL